MNGDLKNVHSSAVVQNMILAEAQWFNVNTGEVGYYLKDMFENYKKYVDGGKRQAYRSKTEFSWNKMVEVVDSVLTESIPEFPKEVQLELPKLQLPKLRKV
jgi:hypothetical protein